MLLLLRELLQQPTVQCFSFKVHYMAFHTDTTACTIFIYNQSVHNMTPMVVVIRQERYMMGERFTCSE